MYLRSIEMFGFKSFAHKMKFEFHNGITGIVGPNGSGKSNVADAVRWVLGEQSAKQLRGASMQDVIFAGTENRKPLSYAYVALTMDNSDHLLPIDYEEVTIARRVYRSGESEYLLNGAPCRLKDVYELFYDTGIGKEGYSIIGQGQIERILSGKPEERRELFDEAVGIVKYKKRKASTIKKLESERENLTRVNDILSEQERLIGPLEVQAKKAREYVKLRDELKNVEINSFLLDMERMESKLKDAKSSHELNERQLSDAKEQQDMVLMTYQKQEEELSKLEERIEELKEAQSKAVVDKNRLENEILLLQEQIRSAENADETLGRRMEELNAEKERRQKVYDDYKKEGDSQNEILEGVALKLKEAQDNYAALQKAIVEANGQIEVNNLELMSILENRATIKSKEQRLVTMAEQTSIRKAKLTQRILERSTKESELDALLEETRTAYEEASKVLSDAQRKEQEFSHKYVEWKNKAKEANEQLLAKREERNRLSSKLETLENIAERYEGYGNSIKRVMEQRDKRKGIEGVVSDIIKVDAKYETAIETALGGNIQNVVTDTEETAKALISFLKENKAGRVTFLPLSAVKGKEGFKATDVLGKKGVIGVANELVSADAKYSGVVDFLLGRVLVCENIDIATAIAREKHYSLHIVTLDGEYLSPGGSMTGGHFKNNSNLLGRNREIEELRNKISAVEDEIKSLRSRIEDIETAQELLEADRAENAAEVQKLALDVNTKKLNLDASENRKKESLAAFEGLNTEKAELDQELNDIAAGKGEIELEKKNSAQREAALKAENELLTKEVDEKTYMEATASRILSEVQIEEANARQKVDFVLENINRAKEELDKIVADIEGLSDNANASKDEIQAKKDQIAAIEETIKAGEAVMEKQQSDINATVTEREELLNSQKGFFTKRQEIADLIVNLDKEGFRLSSTIEKLSSAITYQTDYMWQEYELTPHAAMDLRDDSLIDLDEMKRRASEIKSDIKAMGNVNVGAIEEYRELSERYTFLSAQHDDLVAAEATLIKIIDDLDEGMRTQFNEGFARIQVEFDKAFKSLFGGGKGTLELTEDEDVLESGIRIIAQPPGKKLQNMMQLSGGEKSLTAIALLFGIQNIKPSPFCLLDEIEAALDDANVDRFAKYLNKLTNNTQFIIITHRRGTMNAADRLYGITMQEKGVSALVSVNLIEADLDE